MESELIEVNMLPVDIEDPPQILVIHFAELPEDFRVRFALL